MPDLDSLGREILTGLASVEAILQDLRAELVQALPTSITSERLVRREVPAFDEGMPQEAAASAGLPTPTPMGSPWEEDEKSTISRRSRYAEVTMDDLPMAMPSILAVVPSSRHTPPAEVEPIVGSASEPKGDESRAATPRSPTALTHRAWAGAGTCESLRIAGSKDILRTAEAESRSEALCAPAELLPRLCGVLPWRRGCRLYQMAIWLLVLACTLHLALSEGEHVGEAALGLGALLGLPCLHCRRRPLLEAVWHLRIRKGAKGHKSLLLVIAWALAVAMRMWVADGPLLNSLPFAVLALVNTAIFSVMHRCCSDLAALVDRFCRTVTAQMEFETAVQDWNEIQASCHNVSGALQSCIVVELTAAAFIVWEAVLDFTTKPSFTKGLLPPLIAVLPSFAAVLCAAAVTDKCSRVSPLMNSLMTGEPLDSKRMYVVQYIKCSEAGFTIFNVRVTLASALKAAYVTCAVAVAMMTQFHALLEL